MNATAGSPAPFEGRKDLMDTYKLPPHLSMTKTNTCVSTSSPSLEGLQSKRDSPVTDR